LYQIIQPNYFYNIINQGTQVLRT